MTLRRALLVAPYFPPRRRVGSLRPFRFACYLRQFGWDPVVLCLATPGEELSEAEARRSEHVSRIELSTPLDRTRRHASGDFGTNPRRTQGARPPLAWAPAERASRVVTQLASTLDAWVPLDSWAPLLAWNGVRRLREIARHAPDVIFSTADPWSSHLLGAWLARRLRVPWVADFRDPWTLCPFRGSGPRPTRAINRAFERHVLQRASHVTFTTERTLARYRQAYPRAAARMSSLPNGFDAELLADPIDGELAPLPASAPLTLCFFGRFRELSPARSILLALDRLIERAPQARDQIRLVAVGELPAEDAALAERLRLVDLYRPIAAVPYEHTLRLLRAHDVSLLSTAPERDDIVPAKLWDYLAARRPILSLGSNPDVAELLASHGAGLQLAPDAIEPIAELLERCISGKRRGQPFQVIPSRPLERRVDAFDARRLTERLAALFDALVARA